MLHYFTSYRQPKIQRRRFPTARRLKQRKFWSETPPDEGRCVWIKIDALNRYREYGLENIGRRQIELAMRIIHAPALGT